MSAQQKSRSSNILSNLRRLQPKQQCRRTPSPSPSSDHNNNAKSRNETSESSTVASRDSSTVYMQQMKRKLEISECENRQLRSERDQSIRQMRDDLNKEFQQKLANARQKMQREKEKALQASAVSIRSSYEEKMDAIVKIKDKEIRTLENQLKKSQEKLCASISKLTLLNTKNPESQNLSSSSESRQISSPKVNLTENRTRSLQQRRKTLTGPGIGIFSEHQEVLSSSVINLGLPSSVELARQVASLKEKLVAVVARERHKDAKLKQLEERYEQNLTTCSLKAQQQITSLLEELRARERKIAEFGVDEQSSSFAEERNRRRDAVTVVSVAESQCHSILQPEHHLKVGEKDGKEQSKSQDMMYSLFGSSSRTKSYGGIQTLSKEEHEREKQRWQMKVTEVEEQLRKAEESNAEFLQTKAELNRKIVELEKNQKPLLENNKRLAEKNKHLYQESKKMEEKVRHAQEDYLILKDSYDRLLSEYSKIREKRITPEKLDELERFKQQNLEYCKCITALKQAAVEKDRKLDMLHQKLRRIKKSRGSVEPDDDAASFVSSECSLSSISLDTITEDCEEIEREELEANYRELSKEHLELQRAYSTLKNASVSASEYGEARQREHQLQGQVQQLRCKASELEKSLNVAAAFGADAAWAQEKLSLTSRLQSMQGKIEEVEKCREELNLELEDFREQNELLEFQILEMQQSQEESSGDSEFDAQLVSETRTKKIQSVCDRSVSTSDDEAFYSMDQSDSSSGDEGIHRELPPDELKIRFTLLKHRRGLKADDKAVVCRVKEWLEELQAQHSQCQNKEMEWELKLRETEGALQEEIRRLKSEKEVMSMKNVEMKSVQTEALKLETSCVDSEREIKKLTEELTECEKQCEKLRVLLRASQENEGKSKEMEQKLRKQLSEIGESRIAEIEFMERNSRRHAESLAKLRDELEKVRGAHDFLLEENRRLREEGGGEGGLALEKMRLINCQQSDTIAGLSRSEEILKNKLEDLEERHRDVKNKFKESVVIIRDYEKTDKLYRNKLVTSQEEVERLKAEIEVLKTKVGLSRPSEEVAELRSSLEEQKKLTTQTQSYNEQLEMQFQVQLEMVQILKKQLLESQNALAERSSKAESGGSKVWLDPLVWLQKLITAEIFNDSGSIEENMEKLEGLKKTADSDEMAKILEGLANLFEQCHLKSKECKRLNGEALEAKEAAKEAKERAEQLGKQYHETVIQLGYWQKKQIRREQCVQTDFEFYPKPSSCCQHKYFQTGDLSLATNCTEDNENSNAFDQSVLTQILNQLKAAAGAINGKYQNNRMPPGVLAVLQNLEAEVCQLLRENCIAEGPCSSKFRRHLPAFEFEGTEGESDQLAFGLSNSDDRSSSSASDPAPLSPPLQGTGNSSFSSGADGESSFSDSENEHNEQWKTKFHQKLSRGQRNSGNHGSDCREKGGMIIPESRRVGMSPSNLRLTSSLNDGTYFVLEWDGPPCFNLVSGYNVYIGQSVYKKITDPACGKVLLERTALASLFQPQGTKPTMYNSRMLTVGVASVLRCGGESVLAMICITSDLLRNLETFSNLQKSHLVVQLTRDEACGPIGACLKDWSDV